MRAILSLLGSISWPFALLMVAMAGWPVVLGSSCNLHDDFLLPRPTCVLSGDADLELLATIEHFPLSMRTTEENQEFDRKAAMKWWISRGTGSVQLHPLVPLHILYGGGGHAAGTVGLVWAEHHAEFAAFISSCKVKRVLEIGAGHGMLARRFIEMHPDASYQIVDPDLATTWSHHRVTMHRAVFDKDFALESVVDAVVHSHTLEHMLEPKEFMIQVSGILPDGGYHIFSLPRMEKWLHRNYTNALNWEHSVYLTEASVEYLLKKSNLDIVSKRYFGDDHSVFYAARKQRPTPAAVVGAVAEEEKEEEMRPPRDYARNRAAFLSWLGSAKSFVSSVNQKLHANSARRGSVYVFGAHVFTQLVVALGLDTTSIKGVIDNSPDKAGRRLYGTSLLVQTPQAALPAETAGVVIILRAGPYQDEIRAGILGVNPNAVFWE